MRVGKRALKGIEVLCYHNLFSVNDVVVAVVQSLNRVQLFATPWTATCQAPLSFTISQSFFKFMPLSRLWMTDVWLCPSGNQLPSPFRFVLCPSALKFVFSSFFLLFTPCLSPLFSSIWKHILESLNMVTVNLPYISSIKQCWLKQLAGKSFPTVPLFSEPCFFS